MPLTLYDKIWNEHLIHEQEGGTSLLFVDRHLIHEVTSPQAFEGLRNNSRKVRKPNCTFAAVCIFKTYDILFAVTVPRPTPPIRLCVFSEIRDTKVQDPQVAGCL